MSLFVCFFSSLAKGSIYIYNMHYPKSQRNIINMDIQMCCHRDSLKFFFCFIGMPKYFDILF